MLYSKPYYYYNTIRLRQPVLYCLIDLLISKYGVKRYTRIPTAKKVVIFLNYYAYNKSHR